MDAAALKPAIGGTLSTYRKRVTFAFGSLHCDFFMIAFSQLFKSNEVMIAWWNFRIIGWTSTASEPPLAVLVPLNISGELRALISEAYR